MNNNIEHLMQKIDSDNNYHTKAFQILDSLGNTDPKYHEILLAEKIITRYPAISEYLADCNNKLFDL